MGIYLDVIGAMVAGTMVILTIVNSIFNIQQMNYNVQTMLALNSTANQMTEVIDMMYLEPVAKNLKKDEVAVNIAKSNEFEFISRLTYNDNTITTYKLEMLSDSKNNNYLSVKENNHVVFNSSPFYFDSKDVFKYYDEDFNELLNIVTEFDDIRAVRVDLVYVAEGWNNKNDLKIKYPVTFWRFLKNIYLKEFNE